MLRYWLFIVPAFVFACKPGDSTGSESADTTDTTQVMLPVPAIDQMWNTENTLTTAESVLYDPADNLLYVSCIGAVPPTAKDGDGFISRVRLDGQIAELKWVTGLNAPKGMGQVGQKLYVTDIDRLVEIDMPAAKVTNSWSVDGAQFLNDVSVAPNGKVYFTDSGTRKIHVYADGKISTLETADVIGGVNGVFVENGQLYLAGYSSGEVYRLDPNTLKADKLAEGIPDGDGIERYGNGWLVSNWNGEVHYIDANNEVTELLDSQEAKLNSADIEVIPEKNMMLVPTFFGNTVAAYELKMPEEAKM